MIFLKTEVIELVVIPHSHLSLNILFQRPRQRKNVLLNENIYSNYNFNIFR